MTKAPDVRKPLPSVLPYYRILDEDAAKELMDYYVDGKLPSPFLQALLKKEDVVNLQNPYKREAHQIHRWIQQWMPKSSWGSAKKIKNWCEWKQSQ